MRTIKINLQSLYILAFIIIFSNTIKGQDIILKLSVENQVYNSNELWMDANKTVYIDHVTFDTLEIQNQRIQSIYFNQKTIYKIITYRLFIEKVNCSIDSISSNKVFYHKQDHISLSLDKKNILGIIFDKKYEDVVEFVKTIESNYFNLNPEKPKTISLVKNDGSALQIINLNFIILDNINVVIKVNGKNTISFIKVSKTNSLQFWRKSQDLDINSHDYYILTKDKNWVKISSINKIGNEFLNITNYYNGRTTNMNLLKSSIKGLFFQDLSELYNKDYELTVNKIKTNLDPKMFTFDIKPGYGYWFGINSFNGDKTTEKYFKKLKSGFSLDVNFNVYLKRSIGFGIKYNQFTTKNSIPNLAEDNIRISFIAGTLALRSALKNDKGYFNASFSVGQINYNNSGKVLNMPLKIKGSTIGFYFGSGLDLFISEYVSIGFDAGFLFGILNKADFNGNEYKLDEPANLSRLDVLINLKFHF